MDTGVKLDDAAFSEGLPALAPWKNPKGEVEGTGYAFEDLLQKPVTVPGGQGRQTL